MINRQIFCKYGLIGDNVDLKQNVNIEIDKSGTISSLKYDNPEDPLNLSEDNSQYLIIPGLINSHVHIGDNFAKEEGFNKNILDIVAPPNGLKHILLESTSKDIQIKGIRLAALEMLSNGITCFIDFRERSVEGINLLRQSLKGSPINFLAFGRFLKENEIETVFKLADGVGLPSYNNLSNEIKELLRNFKKKYKKPIGCHVAEVDRDENLLRALFKDDLVDIIVHGTQFINEDLETLKKQKKSLVLCPRCNGYFGVGFPPINDVIKQKIPFSLGTDNLMANNTDLFEEMRYLYNVSRVLSKNEKELSIESRELLKTITINAAKNFNLDNKIGSITEGKFADFIMLDLNSINYYSYNINLNNIYPIIVQRTKSENIKKVYIKGELVFERN